MVSSFVPFALLAASIYTKVAGAQFKFLSSSRPLGSLPTVVSSSSSSFSRFSSLHSSLIDLLSVVPPVQLQKIHNPRRLSLNGKQALLDPGALKGLAAAH
jgi:hypothetical protein